MGLKAISRSIIGEGASLRIHREDVPMPRVLGALVRAYAPAGDNLIWRVLISNARRYGFNMGVVMLVLCFSAGALVPHRWGGWSLFLGLCVTVVIYLFLLGMPGRIVALFRATGAEFELLLAPVPFRSYADAYRQYFYLISCFHVCLVTLLTASFAAGFLLRGQYPMADDFTWLSYLMICLLVEAIFICFAWFLMWCGCVGGRYRVLPLGVFAVDGVVCGLIGQRQPYDIGFRIFTVQLAVLIGFVVGGYILYLLLTIFYGDETKARMLR